MLAVAAGALALAAACGGGGNGYGGAPASPKAAAPKAASATLTVRSVSGGKVLVDAGGDTLYSPDQERNGTIKCTSSCTQIWPPATVGANAHVPTSVAGAHGTIGTLRRPDGTRQLTFDGRPLYTFTLDGGPGTVTGDGTADSFNGTSFTWHAIRPAGGAANTAPSSPASSNTNPYNY
jgi:predicted lipoprotein with Yx(FWY)xxD motif